METNDPKPDKIADILNLYNAVEPPKEKTTIVPEIIEPVNIGNNVAPNAQLDIDYDEVRDNLKLLIDRNMDALTGLMDVATESQNARAYEVVAKLIDSCVQANNAFLDLHKKRKEIDALDGFKSSGNVTNNAIFIGSTKELLENLKLLKEKNGQQQ